MEATEQPKLLEIGGRLISPEEFKATVGSEYECHKVRYRSQRDAQAILNCVKHPRKYAKGRKTRRVGKKDMKPIRAYRCEICGYWHLTSQPYYIDEDE